MRCRFEKINFAEVIDGSHERLGVGARYCIQVRPVDALRPNAKIFETEQTCPGLPFCVPEVRCVNHLLAVFCSPWNIELVMNVKCHQEM